MAIEHMPALDALYMTVITISTVGYAEVKPLDEGGRIFTMGLIVTGVGTAFYLFAAITQFVVEGQFREMVGRVAMKRRIEQLEDLEEIRVAEGSALVGQAITAIEQSSTRLRIVALKRGDAPSTLIPDPAIRIEAGDFLVAIGDRDTLRRLG
jgi:hypothetical protein